ncbi:MAG: SlyX family protein [Treponema sp.]|jgi:SlyX protein|nr:SlyX family protein [Treponema sp.]
MVQQDLERRLDKIETKLAFLEDFLTHLQDETVARNAILEKLDAEHNALKARFLQISGDLEEIPNRRPPHY